MTRPQWNPIDMLPFIIMLAFGGKQLDPWMRRLIDLIEGTQNSVTEMQKGLQAFQQGIYQLMLPPQSNAPQAGPGAEKNPVKTEIEQPAAEQSPHNEPENNQPQTPLTDSVSLPAPESTEITVSTAPPPSVMPVELPQQPGNDAGEIK